MVSMDISLFHIEQGLGFPLILLHGNGEDHTYFEHQIEHFSKMFRVLAVDTRGHGQSPRGTAPFTIGQFADDLLHFMDAHGIAKAHLLGFSDGGNIALDFVMKYPDRVEKLVLNGANLFPLGMKASVYCWVWRHYRRARRKHNLKKQEMLLLMLRQPHFTRRMLAAIDKPALVVVGDRDMIRERHSLYIGKCIKNSRLCIIKGTHFCANKNFGPFNEAVERFLSED